MPKKVTYMRNGEPSERNAKSKGVIGRTSKEQLKKRKEIVSEIVSKYEQISKEDLTKKVKEEFVRLNSDPKLTKKYILPGWQTLRADVIECNGKIGPTIYKDGKEQEELERLSYICQPYIKQVRVTSIYLDRILYDSDSGSKPKEEKFKYPVTSYRKNAKTSSSNVSKDIDKTLMHILVIFTSDGFEELIGNHFLNNYDYVLYASCHKRCVEIVTRLGKCSSLLNAIYKLL